MHSITFKGQKLFYHTKGKGRPIILLHGFLEDSTMWDGLKNEFSENYQLVCVDLPCHGESRFEGEICPMGHMAQMIHQLCSELNFDNPMVIGHSMGGYVGLELAKLRIIDLILLHSNFWADPEEKKRDRNRVIDIVRTNKDLFIREAIPGLFAEENREKCVKNIAALIQKAQKISANEIIAATAGMRDRAPNYEIMESQKVTIIHGVHDPIISQSVLEHELSQLAHQANLIELQKCGHMSIWEAPDALSSAIKNALKSRN